MPWLMNHSESSFVAQSAFVHFLSLHGHLSFQSGAMPLESGLFDSYGLNLKQRPLGPARHLHTGAGRRLTGEAVGIDGVKALDKTK